MTKIQLCSDSKHLEGVWKLKQRINDSVAEETLVIAHWHRQTDMNESTFYLISKTVIT